jgi:hypothetical protein
MEFLTMNGRTSLILEAGAQGLVPYNTNGPFRSLSAKQASKPVISQWMGGKLEKAGKNIHQIYPKI